MGDFMFWVFIMFVAFVAVKVIIYLFEKKKVNSTFEPEPEVTEKEEVKKPVKKSKKTD